MRIGKTFVVAVAVLTMAVSAFAGTVDVKLVGVPLGQNFSYVIGASARTNIAGIVEWQRTGGTEAGDPVGTFRAVCIELDQFARDTTFNVVPVADGPQPGLALGAGPMGSEKAELLGKLWAAHWDEANQSNDGAAAFQVGVWEVIYDDDLDLFGGGFQADYASLGASPAFVQLANTWLSGLANLTAVADLRALANQRDQDQLVLVPLPSAVLTGGMLLAGIAVASVRRQRATA